MSKLFFKVSWQHNIERFRYLQKEARKQGKTLVVRNTSRTRGLPIFLFYLKDRPDDVGRPFSSFAGIGAALGVEISDAHPLLSQEPGALA